VTDSGGDAVASGSRAVTVPEAARLLGISERAVRWQIQAGKLEATRQGRAWTVQLPANTAVASGNESGNAEATAVVNDPESGSAAVAELARQFEERSSDVREKDRIIMELAGQVGYLQAELAQAREQLLLAAPIDPSEASEPTTEHKPLWRRILGL
jgi:excisionase family DNA binding protein